MSTVEHIIVDSSTVCRLMILAVTCRPVWDIWHSFNCFCPHVTHLLTAYLSGSDMSTGRTSFKNNDGYHSRITFLCSNWSFFCYATVLSLSHASTQVTGECNSVISLYNLL